MRSATGKFLLQAAISTVLIISTAAALLAAISMALFFE
jgi:hypothetical protein